MPGEQIDRPNPPPLPSQLPHNVLELAVQLGRKPLPDDDREGLRGFQRAACYIAAGETLNPLYSLEARAVADYP